MLTAFRAIFWISGALCVYVYFGYPALLWIVSRLRPRPVREGEVTPRMSLIIAAYNEERHIAAKIANALALDYPSEQIEVIVVSNGSTDATNDIVRKWLDPRVRLIVLERPGKMEALNEGAGAATGEVLVFTDADFFLEPEALRSMARKFADPEVGGVCGARSSGMRREGDATGEGEGLYGRWDKWQKVHESRIGSVFAADGLLYAVRRDLFHPVSDPAQADDIAISTQVPLQGHRLLFDPEAAAWEEAEVHAHDEFRRKIRVTNHSVRALLNLRSHLFTHGFYSLELLSHKLVRHFVPFFLIPLLVSSVVLARSGAVYALALAAQTAMYLAALAGMVLREHPLGRARLLTVPYFFCFANAAAFFGILMMLRGHRTNAWSSRATPANGSTPPSRESPHST